MKCDVSNRKKRRYAIQIATKHGLSYKRVMKEVKNLNYIKDFNDFKFKLNRRLGIGFINQRSLDVWYNDEIQKS